MESWKQKISGYRCKDKNSPYWLIHVCVVLVKRINVVVISCFECYSLVKTYCLRQVFVTEKYRPCLYVLKRIARARDRLLRWQIFQELGFWAEIVITCQYIFRMAVKCDCFSEIC